MLLSVGPADIVTAEGGAGAEDGGGPNIEEWGRAGVGELEEAEGGTGEPFPPVKKYKQAYIIMVLTLSDTLVKNYYKNCFTNL